MTPTMVRCMFQNGGGGRYLASIVVRRQDALPPVAKGARCPVVFIGGTTPCHLYRIGFRCNRLSHVPYSGPCILLCNTYAAPVTVYGSSHLSVPGLPLRSSRGPRCPGPGLAASRCSASRRSTTVPPARVARVSSSGRGDDFLQCKAVRTSRSSQLFGNSTGWGGRWMSRRRS